MSPERRSESGPGGDRDPAADEASALVRRCLAGDRAAWDAFVERYADLVWSVARGYRLPTADCEDVVQSVFTTAITRLETLRDADRVSAWLITCAHRACWRVGRSRDRGLDLSGDFASVEEPTDERLIELERRDRVRAMLARLGQRCRDLLEALFGGGDRPDYERIAERLAIPIGSIGPTRARCLRTLRGLLERDGTSGG